MEDNSMFSGRRPPLQLLLTFLVYFLAFFITGILLDFFRSKTFTTGEIKDDIYHALLMALFWTVWTKWKFIKQSVRLAKQ
jgi:membrane protease YdiL (CAAX protease family)